MSAAQDSRPRRTQAERRAATRAALLDAAIALLEEEGWSGLTTRKVADRAGVSQGTQMHHFPTRAQFVEEAVRHVAARVDRELRALPELRAGDERRRLEALLDTLWEMHKSPIFSVSMELWASARTDPEARAAMQGLTAEVTRGLRAIFTEVLPDLAGRQAARPLFDTILATLRGHALLRPLNEESAERRYAASRAHFLAVHDALGR